ncbi:MAG: hypothetical protein D3911_08450 [Candidatus Electrothrix sp. AW3_4]|jgi:hypothetical protein|nr:hypothetical protein [Candidatus Electrothrix gigas]
MGIHSNIYLDVQKAGWQERPPLPVPNRTTEHRLLRPKIIDIKKTPLLQSNSAVHSINYFFRQSG